MLCNVMTDEWAGVAGEKGGGDAEREEGKKNRQRQIWVPKAIKAEDTGIEWAEESEGAS